MNSAFIEIVQYHWKPLCRSGHSVPSVAGSRISGTPSNTPLAGSLYWLVAAAAVLNLLDAIFTMASVQAGLAVEANPLMEPLLSASPVVFVLAKTNLVSLGLMLLWRLRRRPSAVAGIIGSAGLYAAIVVYHIAGLA